MNDCSIYPSAVCDDLDNVVLKLSTGKPKIWEFRSLPSISEVPICRLEDYFRKRPTPTKLSHENREDIA